LAGRKTLAADPSLERKNSMISRLSQMWLPVVRTSTPRSSNSSAIAGVRPNPPAAFSAFAISRSTPRLGTSWGSNSLQIARPGRPKISPTNKMRTLLLRSNVYVRCYAIKRRVARSQVWPLNTAQAPRPAFASRVFLSMSQRRFGVAGRLGQLLATSLRRICAEVQHLAGGDVAHQGGVCFQEIVFGKIFARSPLDIAKDSVLNFSPVLPHYVETQLNCAAALIAVPNARHFVADAGVDAQLLLQFAAQCLTRLLAALNLAAGELPFKR